MLRRSSIVCSSIFNMNFGGSHSFFRGNPGHQQQSPMSLFTQRHTPGDSTPKGPGGKGLFEHFFDKALEWCSTFHARDIAQRQGIDLRNIEFVFTSSGECLVRVDAPNATPQQIEALGTAVQEECPVARFRKMRMERQPEKKMQWILK